MLPAAVRAASLGAVGGSRAGDQATSLAEAVVDFHVQEEGVAGLGVGGGWLGGRRPVASGRGRGGDGFAHALEDAGKVAAGGDDDGGVVLKGGAGDFQ